jgi:thioester reductase-like protein
MRSEYPELVRIKNLPVQNIPETIFYASAQYAPITLESESIAHHIAECLCQQVDFPDDVKIFIKVGAGSNCSRWISEILKDQEHVTVSVAQFQMLAGKIDAIYHSVALLNYVYPYSTFKAANVLGTQEILRLACQFKVKPVHYVSSVAIFESAAYAGKVVKEQDDFEHCEGVYLGYSQTKWVAEKLVKIAGDRGLPVTIYRPPLIAGHSKTGVSNIDDFICLMLKGCVQLGSFPDIDYMLDMSPVDYVSQASVY